MSHIGASKTKASLNVEKMNDVCPVGQMMFLPFGKNDAAPFGRNDAMRSAHARSAHHEAKPRIIPVGYIMFRCGGTHHSPTVLSDSRQRYLPCGHAICFYAKARYMPSARDMFASRTRANIISHRARRDISRLRSKYIAFCRLAKHIAHISPV